MANTPYTDEDLLVATQVSYFDFNQEIMEKAKEVNPDVTLSELLTIDSTNMDYAQKQLIG